ncbi:MAG: hypothetical protein ACYTBJ_00465 [Planctomycetota bacterium]|jgi:hypothetical protein
MTIQKLTKEQIEYVEQYQERWKQFLIQLGTTFYGVNDPKPLAHGADIAEAVLDKMFEAAAFQCRGALDQNRLVMLVGRLCGEQLAKHMIKTGGTLDHDLPDQAAKMFEAAFRVVYEEILQKQQAKSKLIFPERKILA